MTYSARDIDTILDHYIVAALWSSSTDLAEPEAAEQLASLIASGHLDADDTPPEMLDDYADDVSVGTRAAMRSEVAAFAEENAADLHGMALEQIGHDFWLTRNHHGAGFWDRGLGERGERLTKAAHGYGGVYLYIGDDGEVYGD